MPSSVVSRHTRTTSPPLSTTTLTQPQRLNVVTRLAIEGKARQGQDHAAIKMFLKLSIPLDSVSPRLNVTTLSRLSIHLLILPLTDMTLPEENIRILTSQVHPIDNNSVPYNFSSNTSPLLHHAARALNLPARSSVSYLSLFGLSPPSPLIPGSSLSRASSSSGNSPTANPPSLDDKYTGHILISGFQVAFVLPKEFPPRTRSNGVLTDHEDGTPNTSSRRRRSSVGGDRNIMQFMAAIDLWVPYVSRPPRAPYLLSIPIPRCLSNNIKLRIFPPTSTSASFASLSSAEEDGGSWDLTSEPYVTRNASSTRHLSRAGSYGSHDFADDESSDSSTAGFPEGCGIQGTFPSAERIRVRWATPSRSIEAFNGHGNGRRRVGVKNAKGEMTCVIRGKGKEKEGAPVGIIMNVEYKGTCKGIWFPGVATLLGMDVGLEAKGSDVSWALGYESTWSVSGGVGYTGYDLGPGTPAPTNDSTDSVVTESPEIYVLPSFPQNAQVRPPLRPRQDSASSLLRADLPNPQVQDFSFEGSTTSSTPSGTCSSISSLPPSASATNGTGSPLPNGASITRSPGSPIAIHLNMNDLLPPSHNVLTFSISGTILVTPRPRPQNASSRSDLLTPSPDDPTDPDIIMLPRFSVLAADQETTSIIVRNDVSTANIEVYNSSGDIRLAQSRKTVLQRSAFTKCGADGGRIALRSLQPSPAVTLSRLHSEDGDNPRMPPSRPRTPSRVSSPLIGRQLTASPLPQPRRSGTLMIPSVLASVTLLPDFSSQSSDAYVVKLAFAAPADTNSEFMSFALALPDASSSSTPLPSARIDIVTASIDGVPVLFETATNPPSEEQEALALIGMNFGDLVDRRKWLSWIKVRVGNRGGGTLVVEYLVNLQHGNATAKSQSKAKTTAHLEVLLPVFMVPVGRLEVNIETGLEFSISSLKSSLAHQQTLNNGRRRLLHYIVADLFHPLLSLRLQKRSTDPLLPGLSTAFRFLGWFLPLLLCCIMLYRGGDPYGQRAPVLLEPQHPPLAQPSFFQQLTERITVTTTVTTPAINPASNWWFGDSSPKPSITAPGATHYPAPTSKQPWSYEDSYDESLEDIATNSVVISNSVPSSEPSTNLFEMSVFRDMSWSMFKDFELPPTARHTARKVAEGLGVVWETFRIIYHYPLPPP